MKQTPVLSVAEMASFMLKNPLEYRRRNLIYLSEIHSDEYVEAVKRELTKQFKKGDKK